MSNQIQESVDSTNEYSLCDFDAMTASHYEILCAELHKILYTMDALKDPQNLWSHEKHGAISSAICESITYYYKIIKNHRSDLNRLKAEVANKILEIEELSNELSNKTKEINGKDVEIGSGLAELRVKDDMIKSLKNKETKTCGLDKIIWKLVVPLLTIIVGIIMTLVVEHVAIPFIKNKNSTYNGN